MPQRFRFRTALPVLALCLNVATVCMAQQEVVLSGKVRADGRIWIQEFQHETPVQPGQTLRLHADFGNLKIQVGNEDRVRMRIRARAFVGDRAQAQAQLSRLKFRIRRPQEGVSVSGTLAGRVEEVLATLNLDFEVEVPKRFHLNLDTGAGEIEITEGIEGRVTATSAAGDIRTRDISGAARIVTATGNIRLGNLGQGVEARTAGGHIFLSNVGGQARLESTGGYIVGGRVAGNVHATTTGGDITLEEAGGELEAWTSGGQIHIGETKGQVDVRSAGGTIRVFGAGGPVEVRTRGGSIDLMELKGAFRAHTDVGRIVAFITADSDEFEESQLETAKGDLKVFLPTALAVTIRAEIKQSQGHTIVSEFPIQLQQAQETGPVQVHGSAELNGGGPVLLLRTVAGNIEIVRVTPARIVELRELTERLRKQILEHARQQSLQVRFSVGEKKKKD